MTSGNIYRDRIATYLLTQFETAGLVLYREVNIGKSIIGKNRIVDLLALRPTDQRVLLLECKSQAVPGTTDEKVYYSLEDLKSASIHAPVCLVYGGTGWSQGVLHTLEASPIAAYCDPPLDNARSPQTRELDYVIAAVFGIWDRVLPDNRRFRLDAPAAPSRRRR